MTIPLVLVVDGQSHEIQNWSLGGFRVPRFGESVKKGDELSGHLVLPYQAFALQLQVRFRIVNRSQSGFGCEFIDLPRPARRALRHLLEAAMEGRLDNVESVLGFVDAPVPTGKLEELLEEEDDTHIKVGRRRLIRKSTMYIGAGAAALIFSLLLLSRNMAFIDVPSGTVMGNFVSVASRVDGRLAEVWVEEGQAIQEGEPLFALSNRDLEEATALSKAGVDAARIRYEALEQELSAELERLDFYHEISVSQRTATEAELRESIAHQRQAGVTRKRLQKLFDQGLVPEELYDEVVEEELVFAERRSALEQRLRIADLNVEGSMRGYFFGGREIEGRVVEVREALRIAGAEVAEAKRAVSQSMTRQEETRVRSPVAGTVYTIYRRGGEVLHSRDPVMSIRTDDGYWATARLAEDEVVRVRPGQPATVVIPSYGLRLKGLVTAVGHQGLSTASQSSADMETSLKEVPIKIQLLDPPMGLPPGIRARIRIQTGSTRLAWLWGGEEDEPPSQKQLTPAPVEEAAPTERDMRTAKGGRGRSLETAADDLRPVAVSLPRTPAVEVRAEMPRLAVGSDRASTKVAQRPVVKRPPSAAAPIETNTSDDRGEKATRGAVPRAKVVPVAKESVEEVPVATVASVSRAERAPVAEAATVNRAKRAAVQLGAFGSEEGAWHYADEVATSGATLPTDADYYLRAVDPRDPDSLVRLLVGPLASSASGEELCDRFQGSGRACIARSAAWMSEQL